MLNRQPLAIGNSPYVGLFFSYIQEPFSSLQTTSLPLTHLFPESKSETVFTDELIRQTAQIQALERVSGMLNELTAEQMEVFEQAVKRRPFFE